MSSNQASDPPTKVQQFCNMIDSQVPESEIREWDKLKLVEAVREKSIANAKSLFLDLKINEQIIDTARIDQGLKNELKQVKANLKAVSQEKDKLHTANQGQIGRAHV